MLAYCRTFAVPFVFDDRRLIVENPLIREFGAFLPGGTDVASAASTHRAAIETRWLSMLTIAVDHRLHGLEPRGYHATNLAIHLLATLALFDVVRRMLRLPALARSRLAARAELPALLVAALFALHPIQTQAVTYVIQRMASLCGALCLVALAFHLRARTAPRASNRRLALAMTALATLGAMLSKQNAFTFPLVILLFDRLFIGRSWRSSLRWVALPLAAMLIVPVQVLTAPETYARVLDEASDSPSAGGGPSRGEFLLTQTRVVVKYVGLLLLPMGQNLDHDVRLARSLFEPEVVAASLLLLGLLATAGLLIGTSGRRDPGWRLAGFGIVWFFATLVVEAGLVPIRDLIFEHRLYLPSAGFLLAVVTSVLLAVPPARLRTAAAALGAGAVVLACLTFARNEVWRSELRLWSDALAKSPTKVRALSNTATALVERGRYAEAEVLFRRALERHPENRAALRSLGRLARARGAREEAESYYRRALAMGSRDWVSLLNLGDLAYERGELSAAKSLFESAAAFEPGGRLSKARLALVSGESPGGTPKLHPVESAAD